MAIIIHDYYFGFRTFVILNLSSSQAFFRKNTYFLYRDVFKSVS